MSGGSYDYLYTKIEEASFSISHQQTNHRRAAFAGLLRVVAQAMHDIEWVDSCDYGPGDENDAIDNVFAFLGSSPDIIAKAHAYDSLKNTLLKYFSTQKETP